jgi:D-inositol-3-phosphate glycosyltransferase
MKITFLGPAYPYRGGLAAFNERLAGQFTEECKDVEICTFRLQYPGFLFPGKTQLNDGPPPQGIKIIRQLNSVNPLNWIRTGLRIKQDKPDILLIRYWLPFMAPCLGAVARIVRSNKYTIIIAIADNVEPHEKSPGGRILTRFFMKSISGAVVMSYSVQKDIEVFRKDIPIVITPHPLFDNYGRKLDRSEALSNLNLDPDYSYILFFGFIRSYKGLDLLINALTDERLRNQKLRLIIAGEFYENESVYRDLIVKNGLEDKIVLFDHFIKDNQVKFFFSGADLVVQPYKSATQSGVTQIAFQFDKPMVVTDVGGLKEIVQNFKDGYVVRPDPSEIADAINDYFENNRKKTFTASVSNSKNRFSWNKMTESINEVFYKVLLQQLIKSL